MKPSEKSNKMLWVIGGVVFVILAAGAVYLGTKNTDQKFGDILPIKPTPTIHTTPKKPDTEGRVITTSRPMPTEEENLSPSPTTAVIESDYLLPTSNSKKIVKEDLVDLTNLDLKRARNEIYARHGRAFVSQDMACYFAKQSWYEINPDYSEKLLSPLEIANAILILDFEKARNSPWVNKDSGCTE